jgi:hypothetical protein
MSFNTPLSKPFDTVLLVGAFSTALLLGFAWILCTNHEKCRNVSKFMWNCFMKPFSTSEYGLGGALESFYAGQADVYDATRQGLLKGRSTMMRLAAAHLRSGLDDSEKGNLVWVDVYSTSSGLTTDWRRHWLEYRKDERDIPLTQVFSSHLYHRFIAIVVQCCQRTDPSVTPCGSSSRPLR